MKDLDQIFESLREEEIDPAALAQVRRRVLDRLEKRGRRWWPVWLAAAACAVMLAGAILWPRAKPVPPVQVALKLPQAPPVQRVPRPVIHRVRRKPPPAAMAQSGPLLMKILTNDPDVVIYWIVEKGD